MAHLAPPGLERARSEASSASTSSDDFYTGDDAPATEPTASPQPTHVPVCVPEESAKPTDLPMAREEEDDDSSSEMDMSEPSRPATPEPAATATAATSLTGAKRKFSDAATTDTMVATPPEDPAKKRKTSNTTDQTNGHAALPVTLLPPEIWQRIFLHLSPAMLCRCLRVCKLYNHYLTGMRASAAPKKDRSIAQVMDSEAIWVLSRKTFFPLIPRPLARFSELGMLQLIGGLTCQFCQRHLTPTPALSHLSAGPGPNGLRVIWPFSVRSCGTCLEPRILKDVQVLSNPRFGGLRLGVPHGFLRSPDLHFASDSVRQLPGGIPATLRFSKINYIADLEAVKAEEEDAKTLGNGAVDEWRKGLLARGKEAMADSARWEKWELQLRPGSDLAQVLREYDASSFPHLLGEVQSKPTGVNGTHPSLTVNGVHPLPQPVHVFQNTFGTSLQPNSQPFPQPPFPQPRQVRKFQEVELARQSRRADIERRCRELEPPLEPTALQHIESFQAALQIATPMTDAAWEVLKPRILAQREAAELYEHERALSEHERASQLAVLRATLPSGISNELSTRPSKDNFEKEYEVAQEPLRKRLGEYADDYINGQWSGGKLLDKDNAPIFAIHVVMHVRRRYAEDKQLGLLPEPPKRREGPRQSTPPPEPFLSLDNMKWVHDKKVRPLTDVHRRELFICAGCTEEKKPKWFAFEGLIQHYGAKHTQAFSRDNIVVHWQTAEWPEDPPPFHTNPAQWLRLDRRPSEIKSNGRSRNTPHNHDGPFPTPPGLYTPQNTYHAANNAAVSHPGYPPGHFASQASQGPSNGYFHSPAAPQEPRMDFNYDDQLNQLSSDSREIWDSLEGIQDMEGSIRVHTVIHHAVSRFAERFQKRPLLDLLTDALATNNLMRPLKSAHGLACKSCVAAHANGAGSTESYWIRIRGVKLYNTSSLITHFKLMHLPQNQYFDWTRDMIELPENSILKELLRTPGMDDDKLALIALAFPAAFPTPLPKIGMISEERAAPASTALPTRLLDRLSGKQKNQAKKKGQKATNGHLDGNRNRDESQEPLPEPKEDEYDPRRPMFVQPREHAPDPSQFDTDARKPVAAGQVLPIGMTLDPETLAALQTLSAATGLSRDPHRGHMRSRSPSVGAQAPPPRTDVTASVVTPTSQPDIAAILASLTGHAPAVQTATPPTAAASRADSAPRQVRSDPHGNNTQYGPPAAYHVENRRPSARHENNHHSPREPRANGPVHELQAALSRNTRQFEQNQQHHTYVEAPYAPAPPSQHPGSRYHYVYEGEQHYSQPQPHAPVYREAPVQYVQIPAGEQARTFRFDEQTPHGYHQYERAPTNQIYVDQYGRPLELIPIDSAPAPVQYAPSHHEQQYQPAQIQPVYDDRRSAYYPSTNGAQQRYGYDDGRASVPRS